MNTVTLTPSWEELETSYADGFDDAVRQAKKTYPDLDFSQLNITHRLKPLLNSSPLRVRRICLLTMQPLATGSLFRL